MEGVLPMARTPVLLVLLSLYHDCLLSHDYSNIQLLSGSIYLTTPCPIITGGQEQAEGPRKKDPLTVCRGRYPARHTLGFNDC